MQMTLLCIAYILSLHARLRHVPLECKNGTKASLTRALSPICNTTHCHLSGPGDLAVHDPQFLLPRPLLNRRSTATSFQSQHLSDASLSNTRSKAARHAAGTKQEKSWCVPQLIAIKSGGSRSTTYDDLARLDPQDIWVVSALKLGFHYQRGREPHTIMEFRYFPVGPDR